MSLINDALKRAKQAPPRPPNALPPLQPVAEESPSVLVWLIPALVILLIVAAIFFIGLASAHHTVRTIAAALDPNAATQSVAELTLPVVVPHPEPPPPVNPPDAPRLQGIFYSPTAPSAIVDGKTVGLGDKFRQYRVKEITKYTVTLVGPDGKTLKIGMGN
jgi:hypothetical protein